MKTITTITIISAIFHASLAFATANTSPEPKSTKTTGKLNADNTNAPNTIALNIMTNALSALKALKKQNQNSPQNIKDTIKAKMLPHIAIEVSTELALKEHWQQLNQKQKLIFQQYITRSLIKDYSTILSSYNKLDSINITTDPEIKRQGNKAIVRLIISFDEDPKPIIVSVKMIRSTHWRIYDVVFSGVSIIKNYRAQFNSHIKRKGIDSLVQKTLKKNI